VDVSAEFRYPELGSPDDKGNDTFSDRTATASRVIPLTLSPPHAGRDHRNNWHVAGIGGGLFAIVAGIGLWYFGPRPAG
jgi:hypothetical protein